MNDQSDNQPLAEWEFALSGEEPTPADRERWERERAQQGQQEADRRAAQVAAWPMLHEIKDGGAVPDGGTVDLSDAWVQLDDVRWDHHGLELVEILADRAGGPGQGGHRQEQRPVGARGPIRQAQ